MSSVVSQLAHALGYAHAEYLVSECCCTRHAEPRSYCLECRAVAAVVAALGETAEPNASGSDGGIESQRGSSTSARSSMSRLGAARGSVPRRRG